MRTEIKPRVRQNEDGSLDLYLRKVVYETVRLEHPMPPRATRQVTSFEKCVGQYALSLPSPMTSKWIEIKEGAPADERHWWHVDAKDVCCELKGHRVAPLGLGEFRLCDAKEAQREFEANAIPWGTPAWYTKVTGRKSPLGPVKEASCPNWMNLFGGGTFMFKSPDGIKCWQCEALGHNWYLDKDNNVLCGPSLIEDKRREFAKG